MIWQSLREGGGVRLVAAALLAFGTGSLVVVSLTRAIVIDDEPVAASPPEEPAPIYGSGHDTLVDGHSVRTVQRDPFLRERPDALTRNAAFDVDTSDQGDVAGLGDRAARPILTLLGTVVLAEGEEFVMCQWKDDPPRLMKLGATLAGYTLVSVRQGSAVFRSQRGEQLELSVPKPGS